ncbi:major capsid protein [uncultured Oxalicibacterium sp.]|uniref:major capsid protein n=1 Tax=uncultured Oxalicibacterium sp. TaxID=1168540 RepID=UPI0025EC6193|nr:major capsid protein [uncultured Oxalicibacterium sp.]
MNKAKRFFGSVKNQAAVAGAAALGLASTGAHAAISTTEVTTALTEAGAAAAVVGAAVLVVIVGIKAFKYIRAAM